ncbi:MAG: hypothetical protein CMQ50_09150 [Gammaproteobacteria bacterium]|nr:hypothetical protein [Gammaproteobacteria bacterium]
MDIATYFTDHWINIEDDRVERYERMFQWRESQLEQLAPASIETGHHILDFGCGPGFFALALADIVGKQGRVYGADINERFISDATRRADDRENISFHHLTDHVLPFQAASLDRVLAKNVLEYVPDVTVTLDEMYRVLLPGGRIHVLDSDWGFVLVEPWGKATADRFFDAASVAFKEPHIGRKLVQLLKAAGFEAVTAKIAASLDTSGGGLSVLRNMRRYIGVFDTMDPQEADELIEAVERGVDDGTYLFALPQFVVTATKPS